MLLYLTPESVQAKDLDSLGLRHIYDDPSNLVRVPIFGGPFGFGCIWGSRESIPEPKIVFKPDLQEFTNFGKFALGWYKGTDYEPEHLARPNPISHHPWQDANGKTWRIPIARRWQDNSGSPEIDCNLPRYLTVNESGQWVYGGILQRYAQLWDIAAEYHERRTAAMMQADEGGKFAFQMPGFDEICSAVWGTNYRVSRYELSFLKAITPSSFGEVLSLVVDDPGFDAISQKKTV